MSKVVDFFDGAETASAPSIGNISANELGRYANDAAYESANVGSPIGGDIYYNTTTDVIRYYDDNSAAWVTLASSGGSINATNIADGSVSNTEFQYINSLTSNVQTQLTNNANDIAAVSAEITNHESAVTDAHDASAISNIPSGNLAATDVQSALDELQSDVDSRILSSEKGAALGVAPLDASSKIDSSYLPSYVDDVLEYANLAAFPVTGETGKIYVAIDTGKIYRWSGSIYIEISTSTGGSAPEIEYRTITSGEALAKALVLAAVPSTPSLVILGIAGAPTQVYGTDFTVSVSTLSWSGTALDGILTTGDEILLQYNT